MKKLLLMTIVTIVSLGISAHRTGVYFYFDNVEKHVYEDENVKVFLYPSDDGKLCVFVNNKTNKVIYVDNGSSFFYTNGKAVNMYKAMTTTSGSLSSSGVAVNLGGIASAMGARGSIATALGAITVSSNSGDYEGITISEKRIIPVAPMSTEAVYVDDSPICYKLKTIGRGIYRYAPDGQSMSGYKHFRLIEKGEKVKMNKGMERQYNEQNSIMSCKTLVRYAFTEDMNNTHEATTDNYLKAIVIDSRKGVKNYEYANLLYCDKYRKATDEYALFEARPDGWDFNPLTIVGLVGVLPLAALGIVLAVVL